MGILIIYQCRNIGCSYVLNIFSCNSILSYWIIILIDMLFRQLMILNVSQFYTNLLSKCEDWMNIFLFPSIWSGQIIFEPLLIFSPSYKYINFKRVTKPFSTPHFHFHPSHSYLSLNYEIFMRFMILFTSTHEYVNKRWQFPFLPPDYLIIEGNHNYKETPSST